MRRTKRRGSFFLCLLINMLMNMEGLIPAVVLLVLHFWLKISIWWAVGTFAVWVVSMVLWMAFIGWAGRCGSEQNLPKENKNPYSAGKAENEP